METKSEPFPIDIGIIIALNEEFEVFKSISKFSFVAEKLDLERFFSFEFSDLLGVQRRGIVTCLNKMGNNYSQNRTNTLLKYYSPNVLINIGISGQISSDVNLGDVVVATSVEDYLHSGKVESPGNEKQISFSNIQHSGNTLPTDKLLYEFIENIPDVEPDQWHSFKENTSVLLNNLLNDHEISKLKRSKLIGDKVAIHTGPFASGPFVGASKHFKTWLKNIDRKYLALDMESHGVLFALKESPLHNDSLALIIRGISDPADERKKNLDNEYFGNIRKLAMVNSTRILQILFEHFYEIVQDSDSDEKADAIPIEELLLRQDSIIRHEHFPEFIESLDLDSEDRYFHYDHLFSFLCSATEEKLDESNILSSAYKYIFESDSEAPINIHGFPGTGKSLFLILLYTYCFKKYSVKENEYIPIYINLTRYNSIIYDTDSADVLSTMARKIFLDDFIPFRSIIQKSPDSKFLIIIDGFDEYSKFANDILQTIYDILISCKHKKVIGLRVIPSRVGDITFEKTPPPSFESKTSIYFSSISSDSPDLLSFIACNLKIFDPKSNTYDADAKFLFDAIKLHKIEEIDLFILYILHNFFHKSGDLQQANLCNCLLRYCHENLSSLATISLSIDEIFNDAAKLAFRWEIPKDEMYEIPTEQLKDHPGWNLIHIHSRLRDYLIAKHFYNMFIAFNASKKGSTKNLAIDRSLKYIYPSRINSFIKDLVVNNKDGQKTVKRLLDFIVRRTNIDIYFQANVAYLAGRIKDRQLKKYSLTQLEKLLETHSKLLKKLTADQDQDKAKKHIHLLRTIYISLISLGDSSYLEKYLSHVLNDFDWDNINRGFHLEYYGDIEYIPTEDLLLSDPLCPFPNTYRQLTERILSTKKGKLFELEVFTLFSLAQHRHIEGRLDEEIRSSLTEVVGILLGIRLKQKYDLRPYIKMVKKHLSIPNFSLGNIIEEIYRLKFEPRKGWNIRKRHVDNCESVATHIYGAFLLAEFFLPDKFDHPEYNKDEIIKMVLYHDIGEAVTGDMTPEEKGSRLKEEEAAHYYLSMIGTYKETNSFRSILKIWNNYREIKDNINAQIAREIDKIDCLVQLYIYKNRGFSIPDFDSWKDEIMDYIQSDVGERLLSAVNKYYKDKIPAKAE